MTHAGCLSRGLGVNVNITSCAPALSPVSASLPGVTGHIMASGNVTIINWERINQRLPWARTPEAKRERRRMWEAIDVNDNGFVSLAEVTRVNCQDSCSLVHDNENPSKGVRDVINVNELFECRPAINAAFHHCKALSKVN